MFWTEEMALDLVSQHFPEFLPIWKFYDMEVIHPPSCRNGYAFDPKTRKCEQTLQVDKIPGISLTLLFTYHKADVIEFPR